MASNYDIFHVRKVEHAVIIEIERSLAHRDLKDVTSWNAGELQRGSATTFTGFGSNFVTDIIIASKACMHDGVPGGLGVACS
jgi:hypothetical protein